MTTTLPRPSRPPLNPPTGPLPSLPVPRTRKAATSPTRSTEPSNSSPISPNDIPSSRTVSSTSLPTRPKLKIPSNNSASGAPSSPGAVDARESRDKTLRKTISIGSFPQPPKAGKTSHPPSPLSGNSTPARNPGQRGASSARSIPSRESSLRGVSEGPKGSFRPQLRSPLGSPSVLRKPGVEGRSVAPIALLGLPSPSQSRNSSAEGSYATSATTLEDINEDGRALDGVVISKSTIDQAECGKDGKDGKGNVIVSVRVRPDAGGSDAKSEQEWVVDSRRSLISYRGREGGDYFYDNVFSADDDNARVYDAAAKRLVRRVMEGYHGTVFAYGMTGTGKTFSMQGTASSPGVIPLAITDIFSFIRETPHREFLLRVSYLEIYNEKIHDLLSPPPAGGNGQGAAQEEIKLREDSKRGIYATPLKEEIVQSPTQLLRVIARGDNARRVAGTQFNARSSRSHAVVQIVVESRERVPGNGTMQESKRSALIAGGVRVSTLSLIDLAGSEKAAESKERRTEGAHINKSLLTLGTVIARLSNEKDKDSKDRDKHLPYRDSKLTRLLQPALSGNSLVSILCTIQTGSQGNAAAVNSHVSETLNTLKFASRAKNNIVSHAKKAEEAVGSNADAGSRALLDRYRMEIQELRAQLEAQNKAKDEAERAEWAEKARELEAEQRHEEQMLEMQLARTALKERIEHLNRLILSSKSLGVNSGRSFSSMSLHKRASLLSNNELPAVSARSSATHATLEVPAVSRSLIGYAVNKIPESPSQGSDGIRSEEEDSFGDSGDGTASFQAQIRALQSDLADKNRYIDTLEKRLLQARRSSQSRVSLNLAQRAASEEGGWEAILQEKDAEIEELRARLDDKDRMVAALRSAARKRDVADLGVDGSLGFSRIDGKRAAKSRAVKGERCTSMGDEEGTEVNRAGRAHESNASLRSNRNSSPAVLPQTEADRGARPVEEINRILDEMLLEGGEGGRTSRDR